MLRRLRRRDEESGEEN